MKNMFRELNPGSKIDKVENIFDGHMKQAEEANEDNKQNDTDKDKTKKEVKLSMTLAMQFYLGYFDKESQQQDVRGGRRISLAGASHDI